MSSLQPLYDVKERLEAATIAGTGLLGEDFRLQRAAEAMKPLAAASPVFGKIAAGLDRLLSAPTEERAGLLLDTLALVDAVAYTQGRSGMEGEIIPLPTGGGTYIQISHGQIQPLLTALTTTGGGRMEIIQSAWEEHPEFFQDFRVMPAVVAGLGDGYGEIADLNAKILKSVGHAAMPLLKQGFDPAGNRAMARRVEVIAAVEGEAASPWLRETLPTAKKDVRADVIRALGVSQENEALLLDLAKTEKGKNRAAVLEALAKMDSPEAEAFWAKELEKDGESVRFLGESTADWAAALVSQGFRERMENLINRGTKTETKEENELYRWLSAIHGKNGPAAIAFWRWIDERWDDIAAVKNNIGQPWSFTQPLSNVLLYSLAQEGGWRLAPMCTELWERDKNRPRYLPHAFVAAFLTKSPEEVYDRFSPYLFTKKPLINAAEKAVQNASLMRGIFQLRWMDGGYILNNSNRFVRTDKVLDPRWIERLTQAVWKTAGGNGQMTPFLAGERVDRFDINLFNLANPTDPRACASVVPYFRQRMVETGCWNAYSRFLLRFGASPAPVFAESLSRHGAKVTYLYNIWDFCGEAAKTIPAGDVIMMLDAFLTSGKIRNEDLPRAAAAIPFTQELLKAGKPYPEWNVWWQMG